jgi:ABC-2 type transport system permease protein
VANEKVVAGMLQSLAAGLVVISAAWLLLGRGVKLSFAQPVLFAAVAVAVAMLAAAGGLALDCSVGQTQIGLMFTVIIAPMIMFGRAHHPWSALDTFPTLQWAVLINPLVYACEGLRGSMAPESSHLPMFVILPALAALDTVLVALGLSRFQKKCT